MTVKEIMSLSVSKFTIRDIKTTGRIWSGYYNPYSDILTINNRNISNCEVRKISAGDQIIVLWI